MAIASRINCINIQGGAQIKIDNYKNLIIMLDLKYDAQIVQAKKGIHDRMKHPPV